jgi:hypothetical protein
MSTVMARRVASTPTCTAAQTWQKIVEILAPDSTSESRKEINKAAGVACAAISSEATRDAPIVVWEPSPPEGHVGGVQPENRRLGHALGHRSRVCDRG